MSRRNSTAKAPHRNLRQADSPISARRRAFQEQGGQ
jgi:hypothetical protein